MKTAVVRGFLLTIRRVSNIVLEHYVVRNFLAVLMVVLIFLLEVVMREFWAFRSWELFCGFTLASFLVRVRVLNFDKIQTQSRG